MSLYTIEMTFSDFALGIEQYEADSPENAIKKFFTDAECLQDYDREALLQIISKRLEERCLLKHVTNGMRGVWIINLGADFLSNPLDDSESIYGGVIIQTDPHAPRQS